MDQQNMYRVEPGYTRAVALTMVIPLAAQDACGFSTLQANGELILNSVECARRT